MNNVSLTFYEIRVHIRRKPQNIKDLDHLEGPYQDIWEPIKAFFNALPAYSPSSIDVSSEKSKNRLFLEGKLKEKGRQFSGLIRHGEDG